MSILPIVGLMMALNAAGTATVRIDSVVINHQVDGDISEWKADKFETDKESLIQYGMDHDAVNFYVAMKISDPGIQMKMIMQGMSLFIYKKGKKKEGTGIEFPIKKEAGGFGGGGFGGRGGGGRNGGGEPGEKSGGAPNLVEMHQKLAAGMLMLKTFGLEDLEDKTQFIVQENGVTVAFLWDEANNLNIEYQIPVKFIGTTAALNGKPLSVGWKINGSDSGETPSLPTGGSGGGRAGGGGGGRGGGGSRGGGSASAGPSPGDAGGSVSRGKEQSIWTKYTLTF